MRLLKWLFGLGERAENRELRVVRRTTPVSPDVQRVTYDLQRYDRYLDMWFTLSEHPRQDSAIEAMSDLRYRETHPPRIDVVATADDV